MFSKAEEIWAKSGRYEQIDALEEHRLFSTPSAWTQNGIVREDCLTTDWMVNSPSVQEDKI